MKVLFNDLRRIHEPLRKELDESWGEVVGRNSFILGSYVEKFEDDFAKFCGFPDKRHAAGVSNGTDALELILRAMNICQEDEIITVANTFTATASAIRVVGATPVFVDVEPRTYLMDVSQVRDKITKATKAIMPVHLYGQQADMESLRQLAEDHDLSLIEDACQAHGSTRNGKHPGFYGHAAAFSFYPGKNLGAFGDAGMVVSSSIALIDRIKSFRNYGQLKKYHHEEQGFNKRLDGLQAAVLSVKLPHLDEWNKSRSESAEKMISSLDGIGDLVLPITSLGNVHTYHVFVVQSAKRDELIRYLSDRNIESGIHYPIPLHLQKSFGYLNIPEGALPITEKAAGRIFSLPIFPYMRDEEVEYVACSLREFFK